MIISQVYDGYKFRPLKWFKDECESFLSAERAGKHLTSKIYKSIELVRFAVQENCETTTSDLVDDLDLNFR